MRKKEMQSMAQTRPVPRWLDVEALSEATGASLHRYEAAEILLPDSKRLWQAIAVLVEIEGIANKPILR